MKYKVYLFFGLFSSCLPYMRAKYLSAARKHYMRGSVMVLKLITSTFINLTRNLGIDEAFQVVYFAVNVVEYHFSNFFHVNNLK